MHRGGISDCSSMGSSGLSHETHDTLSSHWNCNGWAHVLRSAAWVVQGKHTANLSAYSTLPLLISTGRLLSWLMCPCLAGAWRKGCYESSPGYTGCTQGSPCGAEDTRRGLHRCWLTSQPPLQALSLLLAQLPFFPSKLLQALSCTITENKYPLHSPVVFLLCFSLIQWIKIVSVSQQRRRNCSIHMGKEGKS